MADDKNVQGHEGRLQMMDALQTVSDFLPWASEELHGAWSQGGW